MSDETKTEIVPAASSTAMVGPTQEIDEVLAVLDRRQKLIERILNYAIQATHAGQWTMIGDRPWPTGPACEAMARRCGVSWDAPVAEKRDTSDEHGPSYTWTYRARFFLPGGLDSIYAEGHCSSNDQFLGTNFHQGDRSFHEVDEGNIRQAAMTNMIVNGVTRLLGIRNLSQDRLDALLQGGTAAMGKVEFEKGARGGGREKSSDDVELKFGKGKGKMLSEVPDKDVRWYMECWEKDLGNPEKTKFHASAQRNVNIAKALLAARAGKTEAATPWQKIVAHCREHGMADEKQIRLFVKGALGLPDGTKPQELDDAAFERVKKAVEEEEKNIGQGESL